MSKDRLHQAVLETLGYFSLFQSPLTLDELHTRLHNIKIKKQELQKFLQTKPAGIIEKDDFYTVKDYEKDFSKRQENLKATTQKWQIIKTKLDLLAKIPFIRGLCVSGSVSAGNADINSDIDLFVITKKNRIWLCRGFLAAITKLAGWYRQENKDQIQNLGCPNHFIDEDNLKLQPQNIYTAHLYSQFVPIIGLEICEQLRQKNISWIKEFLPNSEGMEKLSINPNDPIKKQRNKTSRKIIETILWGPLGWLAEKLAKTAQKKVMHHHPNYTRNLKSGGLKFSDAEITLHGQPQEPRIIADFEKIKKSY